MEAYDTAVLSYALATAASKLKPGLLGLAPNIRPEDVSLTPPTRIGNEDVLFRMLVSMEQSLLNRIPVHLPQILEMCTLKQVNPATVQTSFYDRHTHKPLFQVDAQMVVLMDGLHHDLRQICKSNPGMQYFLVLTDSKFFHNNIFSVNSDSDEGIASSTFFSFKVMIPRCVGF